jgi:hypothetical protein
VTIPHRLCLIALAAFLLAGSTTARADLLAAIAPDTLVVVGDSAPDAERGAADRLAAALRKAGGPADNLVAASVINADIERAAAHDLLVVGTEDTNRVMQRLPSHWALDRDRYYKNHEPMDPTTPTTGYYAAGYGAWPTAVEPVGYIEFDRNPYWSYATNLLGTDHQDKWPPYRIIGRFYGNSAAGVAEAVDAFLAARILTGVVCRSAEMPGAMSLFGIDTAHYAPPSTAPSWIPAADLTGGGLSLIFAGWQIADSMTYSGFLDEAKVPALRIWRAKYLTEKTLNLPFNAAIDPAHPMTRSPLFEASLARRASDNEFFVAEMASPADAAAAVAGLTAALAKHAPSHAPWTSETVGAIVWQKSRFNVHIVATGKYVVMESFDDAHKAMAVQAISERIAR